MGQGLTALPATALLAAFGRGELSPVEVASAVAERVDALDGELNALTTTTLDRALDAARASEARYRRRQPLALDGVPIVVKDLFDTAGIRTTYGSAIFADHVPTADAAAVARLHAAGAVIIGKGATHEFAWGITTDSDMARPTRNPWATERVAGGSSGGSAAAVAAGYAPFALGTDTAGSIRIPAAFCGLVGLKPTHGAIDVAGVFPLAPSLDHVGPIGRTPQDVALLLSVLDGRTVALKSGTPPDLTGVVIGVWPQPGAVAPSAAVAEALRTTAATLEALGARLVETTLPEAEGAYESLGRLVLAEGSYGHRRAGLWPARADDYTAETRARLRLAADVTLDDVLAASAHRTRLRAAFLRTLGEVDFVLSPIAAGSPTRIGESHVEHLGRRVPFRELVMGCTAPQSLTGLPSCAVRGGFDELGVPVGVQFTGRPDGEAALLQLADAFCRATAELQSRRPRLPSW
ncbi:MAG: hypothetical protein JWQ20_3252 [Conexibacter sp.]|nr:hypothetical protein [Conexibacter sp.]